MLKFITFHLRNDARRWAVQYSVPFATGGAGAGAGGVGGGGPGGLVEQQHLWQQEPSSCLQVDGVAQEHSHTHEVQCFTVLEFRVTKAMLPPCSADDPLRSNDRTGAPYTLRKAPSASSRAVVVRIIDIVVSYLAARAAAGGPRPGGRGTARQAGK
eukprot:SAG31_NODE_669_length_12945_cov_4.141912_4_plen_156_part_00